jgi:arylsulfatase A-like enzyme
MPWAVVLMLSLSCAPGRGVAPGSDLLASFDDAETRSDWLTLPYLLPLQENLRKQGWLESDAGLWGRRLSVRLTLPFFLPQDKELSLRARCHPSLSPLPLQLVLNGVALGEVRLTAEPQPFRLPIPARGQLAGDNTLVFKVPRRYEPKGKDADRWPKAVELLGLEVRPRGSGGSGQPPPAARQGEVVLPGSSRLGYYLRLAPGSQVRLAAQGERQTRLVLVLTDDQGAETLLSELLDSSAEWTVRLPARSGPVRLDVENRGPGALRLTGLSLQAPEEGRKPPAAAHLATAPRPNLIVFLSDALRSDVLGPYGGGTESSPRLDALAAEGLVVEDFRAHTSWTQPTVASLFTGRAPGSHGFNQAQDVLVPQLVTLAEVLQQAGYRTGGFVANNVVSARRGFRQGFDVWNQDPDLYGAPAATLVERALSWLGEGSGPAFVYIHTMEAHWPYQPDAEDWAPFRPADYTGEPNADALLDRQKELSEDELRYLKSLYLGAVRKNDRAFGALLDGLRGQGRLEDSLILFTADHGEEFHEHGGLQHRYTLYEEVLRIPLVVRFPGAVVRGIRDPAPAEQADVLPTVAAFLGLPPPSGLDGRDLSARWLTGPTAPEDRELLASLHYNDLTKVMVEEQGDKLIVNSGPEAFWPAGVPLELYRLGPDPGETTNLADRFPITVGYLRWRARRLSRDLEQSRLSIGAGQRLDLSPEERRKLRALGYIN